LESHYHILDNGRDHHFCLVYGDLKGAYRAIVAFGEIEVTSL